MNTVTVYKKNVRLRGPLSVTFYLSIQSFYLFSHVSCFIVHRNKIAKLLG